MLRSDLPQPPRDLLESIRIPHDATVRDEAWQLINGRAIFGGEDGPPAPDLIKLFRETHRDLNTRAITEAIDLIAVYEGDDPMTMEVALRECKGKRGKEEHGWTWWSASRPPKEGDGP